MNVARARTGCVCACSKQNNMNEDDIQSCTTAVETDSYYGDSEEGWIEASVDGDVIMTSRDNDILPDTFEWEYEEIDAADLGTFPLHDIIRTLARFQRMSVASEMDVSEAVWGGSSPSASIMVQQEVAPEHSMADSEIMFGQRSSDMICHAGNADLLVDYAPRLTILPFSVEDATSRSAVLSYRDRQQHHGFQTFDLW